MLFCISAVHQLESFSWDYEAMEFYWNSAQTAEFLNVFLSLSDNMYSVKLQWILLNRAPTSTQLHPHPPSSFQPPASSFQPPPSSLQHPQQYLKQYIARNWAISPNLGRKIKCYPFWLKIGSRDILEVLIPNSDLDFWNFDAEIHFWANLGPKSQLFVLSENWYTWYLKDANPYCNISFLNFKS